MALMEQIETDYKAAFKSGAKTKVDMLRMLKSALKNAEIEARHPLTDPEVITVMTREAKRRREAIQMFQQGNRADLVEKENGELQELMYYLPTQMSDSEIEAVVKEIVTQLNAGPKDFGKVMGMTMKKVAGQADGERVTPIVKKLLPST